MGNKNIEALVEDVIENDDTVLSITEDLEQTDEQKDIESALMEVLADDSGQYEVPAETEKTEKPDTDAVKAAKAKKEKAEKTAKAKAEKEKKAAAVKAEKEKKEKAAKAAAEKDEKPAPKVRGMRAKLDFAKAKKTSTIVYNPDTERYLLCVALKGSTDLIQLRSQVQRKWAEWNFRSTEPLIENGINTCVVHDENGKKVYILDRNKNEGKPPESSKDSKTDKKGTQVSKKSESKASPAKSTKSDDFKTFPVTAYGQEKLDGNSKPGTVIGKKGQRYTVQFTSKKSGRKSKLEFNTKTGKQMDVPKGKLQYFALNMDEVKKASA